MAPGEKDNLTINLPGLDEHMNWTQEEATFTRDRVQADHSRFLCGDISVSEVLHHPAELVLMSILEVLGETWLNLEVTVTTDIPIGGGQGSSASILAATTAALMAATDREPKQAAIADIATRMERYQHGTSSGADPMVCTYGGLIRFQKDQGPQPLPPPNLSVQIIETGRPESTTGECVSAVAARCGSSSTIWDEFERVTHRFQQSLLHQNSQGLHQSIRDNHNLLNEIGVVPKNTAEFIKQLEAEDASAKVCGAGTIVGNQAGTLLLYADGPRIELCHAFGYVAREIKLEKEGVCVI